jgi:CubicO group peptidase (beta-lactamase class C family)
VNHSSSEFLEALPLTSPQEAGLLPLGVARLEAAMRREVELKRLPGAAMLISRGGRIGYRGEVGSLRPGGPAMRSDAIFRIYSMTKPITSIALMMLVEEGRVLLTDPLSKYAPEFAAPKVGIEKDGKLELVPAERPITIQDLLRHTSGLTYAFTGESAVQRRYAQVPLRRQNGSSQRFLELLSQLPLIDQPGAAWHYSHSTDVIGRVIEIVAGQRLSAHLTERILVPLGMKDTGYFAPPDKHERIAEPFERDPDTGEPVKLFEARVAPGFEMGGSGMVSTIDDYARFCLMLLRGGAFDARRFVSRKTLAFMASDHLGPDIRIGSRRQLPLGYGFGLGFGVRKDAGRAPWPGTVGEFYWGGLAGTSFWIDPGEDLFAILMIQAEGRRSYYRELFRNLVHAALA